MTHFVSAFQAWFESLGGYRRSGPQPCDRLSLRKLAESAGIPGPLLTNHYNGKRPITLDSLSKLLPAIEKASDRQAALTILIAYLKDETPPDYSAHIRIEAIDAAGQSARDIYSELSISWEERARSDPNFFAMWLAEDNYMHHPERIAIALPQEQSSPSAENVPTTERPITTLSGHQLKLIEAAKQPDLLKVAESPAVYLSGATADEAALAAAAIAGSRQAAAIGESSAVPARRTSHTATHRPKPSR